MLVAPPEGGLAVVALPTDGEDSEFADVKLYRLEDGEVVDEQVLNQDEGGGPQMEPWITLDHAGGMHVTWYDGREDEWRLSGASSIDGGDTWTEYAVGDNSFRTGFDEDTQADALAWVGHFQGLVATDDHVVAIFGDNHGGGHSNIYAARSIND